MIFKPYTTASGAYLHEGIHEYELYAELPGSDALVAVLQVDTDCPGQVYCFVMRGGITEGKMTAAECISYSAALQDMVEAAHRIWPKRMREEAV